MTGKISALLKWQNHEKDLYPYDVQIRDRHGHLVHVFPIYPRAPLYSIVEALKEA